MGPESEGVRDGVRKSEGPQDVAVGPQRHPGRDVGVGLQRSSTDTVLGEWIFFSS